MGLIEHRDWCERAAADLTRRGFFGDQKELGELVEGIADELLGVTQMLAERYGTPDLGNKDDSIDELAYIILSRRTREGAYQAAFAALKRRYPSWDRLASAPIEEIVGVVGFSGLGKRKAVSLRSALRALITRFGQPTLQPTAGWHDDAVLSLLCSLPEIGPKSAACVMLCSLDRPAFPVDAHVGRVLERLGVFEALDIDLAGTGHKVKQRVLWDAVPPSLRYSLHVNLVAHGRSVCRPSKPRCWRCPLAGCCAYAKRQESISSSRSNR